MAINYEKLIKDIVAPLVIYPEDIVVKILEESQDEIIISLFVNENDIGRTIGKSGRTANAIRTIIYAAASKEHKRVQLEIDSF